MTESTYYALLAFADGLERLARQLRQALEATPVELPAEAAVESPLPDGAELTETARWTTGRFAR